MSPHKLFGHRFFYGWVVAFAAFLLMFVAFGVAYSFGPFFESLGREFGAERSTVSLVFSITGLLYFGLGAITGPVTDRFGPRLLSVLGAAMYLIGLGLASQATEIWQVYVTYSVFVGVAVAATYVPSVSTVQRWFQRRRAFASGIAVSGIGVGNTVVPPLTSWLIATQGWRTAYLVLGVGAAVLTLIAGWLLLRSPAQIGLGPDGEALGPTPPPLRGRLTPTDRTVGEAIRTREFLSLYLVIAFTTLPVFFGIAHIVPFARDAGLDQATASAAGLSGIGLGSAVGRLIVSPFSDRFGRRRLYGYTVGLIGLLMIAWTVLPGDQVWLLALFAFLFGTAYGNFVALCPAMMADYFGTSYVSGTIGVFYTGAGIGAFAGPLLGGFLYDATGSYTSAILVGAATGLIATAVVFLLRDPARVKAQWTPAVAGVAPPPASAGHVAAPAAPASASVSSEPAGAAPAEPAPAIDSARWAAETWSAERAAARCLERWAGETSDAELADVLIVAAARARDRAFVLRRAAPEAATDGFTTEAERRLLRTAPDDLARLQVYHGTLAHYDRPDAAALLGADRLAALAESERGSADLIAEQIDRLTTARLAGSVERLDDVAAWASPDGLAWIRRLAPPRAGRPGIDRIVVAPGATLQLAADGSARSVVVLQGRATIGALPDEARPLGTGQLAAIGDRATAHLTAVGDLPLVCLLIGDPLSVGPSAATGVATRRADAAPAGRRG